jgi:glyoxylase-like metal-dependent hydrolase (beta-lactamase superfamily II)
LDAGGDANRAYVILPEGVEWAWCVDPSFGAPSIDSALRSEGRVLSGIFLTHGHRDHTAGVAPLMERHGCPVWCHPRDAQGIPGARPLEVEGPFPGTVDAEVLFTPGHTPGSVCYRVGTNLFTGDTLFVDWVGRADFPGGDPVALFGSLGRLRTLPGHLRILPGHDYGAVPSRTLAEEVEKNRFLACTDYNAFLRLLPELAE